MSAEKQQGRGKDQFRKFRKCLSALAAFYKIFPIKMRIRFLEKRRYTRGKLGLGIRYALLKSIAKQCGDNVVIYPGAYIFNPQNLIVGSNVSIQPMCYIECSEEPGAVQIDDDVSISHGVTIMATTHVFKDTSVCIKDQGVETKPVHICQDVWIGAKATILAGVTIASGCVIGANAVVTKTTQENGIYVGIPARRIKDRTDEGN